MFSLLRLIVSNTGTNFDPQQNQHPSTDYRKISQSIRSTTTSRNSVLNLEQISQRETSWKMGEI